MKYCDKCMGEKDVLPMTIRMYCHDPRKTAMQNKDNVENKYVADLCADCRDQFAN